MSDTADSASSAAPEETKRPKAQAETTETGRQAVSGFIDTQFIPAVSQQLNKGIQAERLERIEGETCGGGTCPMVIGELPGGRRFWLCFGKADIASPKLVALADAGSEPTLLESFLIDEKRMSLPLLVSRLLQRLNGQKWLGRN